MFYFLTILKQKLALLLAIIGFLIFLVNAAVAKEMLTKQQTLKSIKIFNK